MKNWKSLIIAALGFFTIAGMVVFSSCEKDPCMDLSCQNGGNCTDGYCQCPTGYEGTECDITLASKYVGVFSGSMQCGSDPATADSITIELVNAPDEVRVKIGSSDPLLQNLTGKVLSNEATLNAQTEEGEQVHVYLRLNGSQLTAFLDTKNTNTPGSYKKCFFSGSRLNVE